MPKTRSTYRNSPEYAMVYSELITAAKYRGYITYQEIAKLLGWPLQGQWMGAEIGKLLGQISEDEHACGRPLLSAIAVSTTGRPGPGFFEWARQLRRLDSEDKAEEKAFWEKESRAVHETWKVILPKGQQEA